MGEVGGYAYGGSVPAPVQSLDAATVAMTASGKSWGRLKAASNGNPYLHTIYDAFKVDAMGYDVVLDEVNKNWLKAGMNWSYLQATQDAVMELRQTFRDKYKGRPANSPLTEGEARQMMWFLQVPEGGKEPTNLTSKMSKIIHIPDGTPVDKQKEMGKEAARNILRHMKARGYDYRNSQPTVGMLNAFMEGFAKELNLTHRLGKMIQETNNKKAALAKKIRKEGHKVYQYYAH